MVLYGTWRKCSENELFNRYTFTSTNYFSPLNKLSIGNACRSSKYSYKQDEEPGWKGFYLIRDKSENSTPLAASEKLLRNVYITHTRRATARITGFGVIYRQIPDNPSKSQSPCERK